MTEILTKILNNIDEIQSKIPENIYLNLCNDLKQLYDLLVTIPSQDIEIDTQLDNQLIRVIYESIINDYSDRLHLTELHLNLARSRLRNQNSSIPIPEDVSVHEEVSSRKRCDMCNTELSQKTSLRIHQQTRKCMRLRTT